MKSYIHSVSHAAIAEITLDRADLGNALSVDLISQLDKALEAANHDKSVKVIVLAANGKHFAAGADIKEMIAMEAAGLEESGYVGCSRYLPLVEVPVVCAVEGMALGGGCELIEMCDVVVASESAAFGHPEVSVGTMSGAGGTQRLVRAVGKAVAMDVLFSGRRLSAAEALACGLVSRVVPPGAALAEAKRVAATIAGHSRPILQSIKRAVTFAYQDSLDNGLAFETRLFRATFELFDRREGMKAFVEKRKPLFRDA